MRCRKKPAGTFQLPQSDLTLVACATGCQMVSFSLTMNAGIMVLVESKREREREVLGMFIAGICRHWCRFNQSKGRPDVYAAFGPVWALWGSMSSTNPSETGNAGRSTGTTIGLCAAHRPVVEMLGLAPNSLTTVNVQMNNFVNCLTQYFKI